MCSRSWPFSELPVWATGGASGGRRGGPGRAHDRAAAVERARPVRVCDCPRRHRRHPQPSSGQPGGASPRRSARSRRGAVDPHAAHAAPRGPSPAAVDALVGALRTHRDRAMVEAMVLGGLRRCEVLGLRLEDVNAGEAGQRLRADRAGRRRTRAHAGRDVVAVPFERGVRSQVAAEGARGWLGQAGLGERVAARRGAGGQVEPCRPRCGCGADRRSRATSPAVRRLQMHDLQKVITHVHPVLTAPL